MMAILSRSIPLRLLGRRHDLFARAIPPRPHRILARNHRIVAAAAAKPMLPFDIVALPHVPERLLRVRGPLVFEACDAPVAAVVVFKGVGFLAVDGEVADFAHFVRHAQGDAAHVFDEDHDEGGPDDVPTDGEEGADDLEPDLAAVACDGAAGVGETEGGAAFLCGPEAWRMVVSGSEP